MRHVRQTLEAALAGTELMEVHYGQRSVPEAADLQQPAMDCLEQLLASERYLWLVEVLQGDPRYLIEPPGYGEARLQGMKIYAKVDCLIEVGAEVVILDWKTGRRAEADPLQLALYRLAWAELHELDPAQVRAAFCYVRTGEVVEPDDLPGRVELEALLAGA